MTYREIREQVLVSKSSLSLWLRGIPLTQEQQTRIHGKNLQIRRKFVEYNQRKREAAVAQHRAWRELAKTEGLLLSNETFKWVGVALYRAEGATGGTSGEEGRVKFAN